MADRIEITGLKVPCVIGVFAWERAIEQTLHIDVSLTTDIRPAAASDRLEDALNYVTVSQGITALVRERKANLIETLAQEIADWLLVQCAVSHVVVEVRKPLAVPQAHSVGVPIERP